MFLQYLLPRLFYDLLYLSCWDLEGPRKSFAAGEEAGSSTEVSQPQGQLCLQIIWCLLIFWSRRVQFLLLLLKKEVHLLQVPAHELKLPFLLKLRHNLVLAICCNKHQLGKFFLEYSVLVPLGNKLETFQHLK